MERIENIHIEKLPEGVYLIGRIKMSFKISIEIPGEVVHAARMTSQELRREFAGNT